MRGQYHVIVQNKRLRYEFDIKRNITIIRGDSATGKTTLYSMIALAANPGTCWSRRSQMLEKSF